MLEIQLEQLKLNDYMLYVHTPFCGTCHLARSILEQIEGLHGEQIFYEMNASLFPEFMQEMRIESVPCLLIKENNEIKDKVYAFKSVSNIYKYVMKYRPELFKT